VSAPTPAGRIRATLQTVVDALAQVDVNASIEPGQVPVPGAWVQARHIDAVTLAGLAGGNLQAYVWLIAADTGTASAMDKLAGLLDAALRVIEPSMSDGEVIELAQAVVLPHLALLPCRRSAWLWIWTSNEKGHVT
jgi:hypothetical protein